MPANHRTLFCFVLISSTTAKPRPTSESTQSSPVGALECVRALGLAVSPWVTAGVWCVSKGARALIFLSPNARTLNFESQSKIILLS